MMNKLWAAFIVVGIVFCMATGNAVTINNEMINGGKSALQMVIEMLPLMAIWSGLMNIASKSGLLNKLSIMLSPILHPLFPDIEKGHESLGLITSNMVANVFGLGSAATPFGLKAMKSLQELNREKKVASRSMITFLVLNTSGLTLIPTTTISLRMMHNSINPTEIILASILATITSTLFGLLMNKFLSRKEV